MAILFIVGAYFAASLLILQNRSFYLAPVLEYLLTKNAILYSTHLAQNPAFPLGIVSNIQDNNLKDHIILLLLDDEGRLILQNQEIYPEKTSLKSALDVQAAFKKGIGLFIGDVTWLSYRFSHRDKTYVLRMGYLGIPWNILDTNSFTYLVLPFSILLLSFLVLIYLFVYPYFRDINKLKNVLASIDQENFQPLTRECQTAEFTEFSRKLQQVSESFNEKIAELNRKNMEVETLLGGMTEGVILIDERLFITRINPAAKKFFNITELPRANPYLLEVTHSSALLSITENILWNQVTQETEIVTNEGRKLLVRGNIVQGHPHKQLVLIVLDDITELQRLEEIRKDFVANVSHELKTPVTVIKGYIETILRGKPKKEDRRQFLKTIRENADRMANIIEDLLTLSRLEKDRLSEATDYFDMIKTIHEAIHLYEHEATKKSIDIIFQNDLTHAQVRGHQRLALQALCNLISNAIKYSVENSRIDIKYSAGDQYHVIEVIDQGIGIPHKDLDRIFERFYRVDKSRSREMGGTGLGLSIVKHIMLLHGGKVEVLSTLGSGSKFILYFPR